MNFIFFLLATVTLLFMFLIFTIFRNRKESCVVVNLGAVSVKSAPRSDKAFDVHQLFKAGADDDEILKQAILHSYDKFILKLTDMQV